MSNFAFMNNSEFLKHPGCRRLYEFALAAEENYRFDHAVCAMKVRFALEQACVLGIEMRQTSFPQKISMLGDFWCEANEVDFYLTFDGNICNSIKNANRISRSYLHTGLLNGHAVPLENLYPEMLKEVYIILLWIYKKFGYNTKCTYSDYSVDKIPLEKKQDKVLEQENSDIYYSPEEVLKNFKKYFPNCQTESLCTVEKTKDAYIVKDIDGKIISEFVRKEDFQVSEEEKKKIRKKLETISKEYDIEKQEFIKNQQVKDAQILAYKNKIDTIQNENHALSNYQENQLKTLKQKVEQFEQERDQEIEEYRRKIFLMGEEYDELYDKYIAILPAEEKRKELNEQVLILLKERQNLESDFQKKEKLLLDEIGGLKDNIHTIKRELTNANASSEESRQIIESLEDTLKEKEQSLMLFQKEAGEYFNNLQAETAEMIKSYKDKAANLEIILSNVLSENEAYKKKLQSQQMVKETVGVIQIVKSGIVEITNAYTIYKQDANERKLRELLLKVKAHYEEQIQELEQELLQKERELERERLEKERIMREMWRAQQSNSTAKVSTNNVRTVYKSKTNKLWYLLVASVVVLLLVLGKVIFAPVQSNDENMIADKENQKEQNVLHGNNENNPVGNNMENSVVIIHTEQEEDSQVEEDTQVEKDTQAVENTQVEEDSQIEEDTKDVENTPNTENNYISDQVESSQMKDEVTTSSENQNPDKLDQLLADREWANSRPKDLSEIPNVSKGMKDFVVSEYFIHSFEEFYGKLELLGEADIYSVANKDAPIYTADEYEWMTFCWISSKHNPNGLIMYMEPSVVSAELNRNSTRTQVVEMLGEPTSIYYDIGWSDFNFSEIEEADIMYEWTYEKEGYSVNLRFVFDGERILDYCQVIIDVD